MPCPLCGRCPCHCAPVPSPAPKESGGVGATFVEALDALNIPAEAVEEFLLTPKAERHPLEVRRDALVATLLVAGFEERLAISERIRRYVYCNDYWIIVPNGSPVGSEEDFERALGIAEAALKRLTSTVDSPLPGRWGHRWDRQHSAPLPEGLAGLGARGHEPLAPGPTLADVQALAAKQRDALNRIAAQLAGVGILEEVKASPAPEVDGVGLLATRYLTERDRAASERKQANEWLSQLHDANERIAALKASNTGIAQEFADVNWTLNALGASGTGPAKERLMQVIPLPRVVALLEVEAAEADTVVKRIRCRNPDMTSGEEPLSAAMDREQEARERLRAARDRLDHLPEAGKMVQE